MKTPSINALMAPPFELARGFAKLIKELGKNRDNVDKLDYIINMETPDGRDVLPKTKRYLRSLYSSPYNSRMWRTTMVLHAVNEIVEGHGVESLGPSNSDDYRSAPPYEYINMGDPYAATLIYDRSRDRLYVGDWGAIAEKHPNW